MKIVQKSFGVMRGEWVGPKAVLGNLAETGTMSVGLREPGGSVPPWGQEFRLRSPMTSRGAASGVAAAVFSNKARRASADFILIVLGLSLVIDFETKIR